MPVRTHRIFLAIFVFVLAPIGAVVLVAVLLLFGMRPPVVFAAGRGVKSLLELTGFHPANRVAVASTVAVYWAVIVIIGLVWERFHQRRELDQ